ncbi:MAG: rhomboid family intramembrane serine protease [Bacteroidales bacterium]|nr:rhomboid family intramembrane serine protease [Bacteroidales bacterium]
MHISSININLFLILITVLVSVVTWKRTDLFERMLFHSPSIVYRKEWHRMITYGFLHTNLGHLFVNMFVLWMFGRQVEEAYVYLFEEKGHLLYLVLYLSAIVISTLYDLKKRKDDYNYRAVGASGAVSAVLFAYIFLFPTHRVYFLFIPVGIPAVLFGILYLIYSSYMSKQNIDNVGHDAHFWGGVYGFLFTIPFQWELIGNFFEQIRQLW